MLNMVLSLLKGQPKFKTAIEQVSGQPIDHVVQCAAVFLDNIKRGPGLVNTEKQKIDLFNRLYQGGLALGFSDWESELCAAKIAGYSDMEVCLSFRERHRWPQTTVESIQILEKQIMPRFVEAGKRAGLLPPDMFPVSGIPQTEVSTSGGSAPWETLLHSGANGSSDNNIAP